MDNNLSLEQLNNRLNEINKQIMDIENLSNNPNIETVTITTFGNVNKKISKEKTYLYMNLIEEKQRITNQIKIHDNNKEKEDKQIDEDNSNYQIINRDAHFKDGSFHRVNEKNSILSTTKGRVRYLEEPFKIMREQGSNIGARDDLSKAVITGRENMRKIENAKKRVLVPDSKGFISNAAFIIITSVFITVLIFLVVGFIVFR